MQKYFTRSLYADDKAMFADMMKYIRELEQELEQLKKDGWVKVEDGLPKDKHESVLIRIETNRGVYHEVNFLNSATCLDSEAFCFSEYARENPKITHWKPITPPTN